MAEQPKKKISKLSMISTSIFGVIILYLIIVLTIPSVPFLFRYQTYTILTPSMRPTIEVGDLVAIDRWKTIEDLEEGDIIAFYVDRSFVPAYQGDRDRVVVVHYIYEINPQSDGTYEILTIAEVSNEPDEWVLNEDDIIGRFMFNNARVGRFLTFTRSGIGRVIIAADIILIVIIFQLLKAPKKKESIETKRKSE